MVVFSGVASDKYDPNKIYNWNDYSGTWNGTKFDKILIMGQQTQSDQDGKPCIESAKFGAPGYCNRGNVYASSVLRRRGRSYLFYGGNDFEFHASATDTTYLAMSDNFLSRPDPADISPPKIQKLGVTLAGGDNPSHIHATAGWGLNDPSITVLNWQNPSDPNFDNSLILFSVARPHETTSTQSFIGWALTNLFPQLGWYPPGPQGGTAGFCDTSNPHENHRCKLEPKYDNKIRIKDNRGIEISTAHRPSLVRDGNDLWLFFDQGGIYDVPYFSNADWVAENYLLKSLDFFPQFKNPLEAANCHNLCSNLATEKAKKCISDCYRHNVEQVQINDRIKRDCENPANIPCIKVNITRDQLLTQNGVPSCYKNEGLQPELTRTPNGGFCMGSEQWKGGVVVARTTVNNFQNFTIVSGNRFESRIPDGGTVDVKKFGSNWLMLEDSWPQNASYKYHIHPRVSTDGLTWTRTPAPIWTTQEYRITSNPTAVTDEAGQSLRGIIYGDFSQQAPGQCNPAYLIWEGVCISQGAIKAMFLQKRIEFVSNDGQCDWDKAEALALDEDRTIFLLPEKCSKNPGVLRVFDTGLNDKISKANRTPLLEIPFTLVPGKLYKIPSTTLVPNG